MEWLKKMAQMLKQYGQDAMPGGSLNPETRPLADVARYGAGVTDANSQISRDLQSWHQRTQRGLADQLAGRETPDADYAYNQMMNMAGVAPIGMTVWHGSPHKFTKFDMSKIGTGEGAQAYGHGLYMAEAPDVAKSYADELGQLEILHNNKVVGVFDKDPAANAAHQIRATGGDVDKAIKRAQNIYTGAWRDNVVNEIKKLGPGDVSERVNGSLYKVDIPDEAVARFLDWDKPLSQQAPEVQRALGVVPRDFAAEEAMFKKAKEMGVPPTSLPEYQKLVEQMDASRDLRHMSGAEWYQNTTKDMKGGNWKDPQDAASQYLHQQLGIPGIRYLDGGSRGAGNGTSNFVLFDDQLPRIIERNGQATGQQPWKPGEWAPFGLK